MKKFLILLLIFTIISTIADEFLVKVDNLVKKRDFFVIEQVYNHYILIADNTDVSKFKQRGYSYKILDNNPREKNYYLVFPVVDTKEAVARVGTILAEFYNPTDIDIFQKSLLVRVPKNREEFLFDLKVEKNYLEFDRVVYPQGPTHKIKKIDANNFVYNPLIEKMIDSVSIDTLRYVVKYLQDIQSRHVNYDFNAEEAVPWICEKLRAYGCDSVYAMEVPDKNAPNPIGIRLGQKYPSYTRYFVIGGHPDAMPNASVNYGADDNASGAAGMMEAARVMKNYLFEYTIIYIGFNAEEVGYQGSAEFTRQASARGDTIIGAINFDMIGHTNKYERLRIRYNEEMPNDPEMADIFEAAADNYTQLDLSVSGQTGDGSGSDHASFWRKGYPCLFAIEGEFCSQVYHTLADTLDCPIGLNNCEFFARVVQTSIAALAMEAAAAVIDEITPVTEPPKEISTGKFSLFPNDNNSVRITFSVDENGPVDLRVYNIAGQLINIITSEHYQKGTHSVVWDGCDSQGKQIAKGVYFFKCSTKAERQVRKLLF